MDRGGDPITKKLTLTPIVDPSGALKGFARIQSGADKTSSAFDRFKARGSAGLSSIESAFDNSGLSSDFGQVDSLVQGLSGSFSIMGDDGKLNLGMIASSAGVGLAALGGVAETMAGPLEAAQAKLQQSVKNTGTAWKTVAPAVTDQDKKMQKLGFTYQDTDQSLELLTQGLGSPKTALEDESLAANLAARGNMTLSEAAQTVVKAYAQSPMVLHQFGINLTNITAKGTAAVAAQKAAAKAQLTLQKDQLSNQQLQARLGATSTTKSTTATNSLATAQGELQLAGEKLQETQAKIDAGTLQGVTAENDLESAQQRVAAATLKYQTAQSKVGQATGLTISQQQQLANSNAKVEAAQALVASTASTAAADQGNLGDANLTGGQILDMLKKKTEGLALAQSKTFGGDLRMWKARIIDFGATEGEKFAKPLILLGPAMAGVGALIQTGFFNVIGKGLKNISDLAIQTAKSLLGIGDASAEAQSAAAKAKAPTTSGVNGSAARASGAAGAAGEGESTDVAAQLQTAADSLITAGESLQTSALALKGAAGAETTSAEESGASIDAAASRVVTASTGLTTSSGDLDASATALEAASAKWGTASLVEGGEAGAAADAAGTAGVVTATGAASAGGGSGSRQRRAS